MKADDAPYILAFSVFSGIGPVRFRLLYEYFGSAQNAWQASHKDLRAVGLSDRLVSSFIKFRQTFSHEGYRQQLERKNIRFLSIVDDAYPDSLRNIPDPPIGLYCFGDESVSLLSEKQLIGVVGTRRATVYGKTITRRFVEDFVQHGFCVVSGMARGIDTVAHRVCLDHGGKTIAVLGCGIDIVYPPENDRLYDDIARHGLVISEMPIGYRPEKGVFRTRNRIISGLCRGIVVMEAGERSGALITARYAAEQGRDVFAVPGPVTSPTSHGIHELLKHGATVAESARDIIQQLSV
ncbi:MAG: DNA-processing protein DprA [Patescibacteria group bacterium]|nr:DNA-processing protein DprA [Patescibacteria group bacterium]